MITHEILDLITNIGAIMGGLTAIINAVKKKSFSKFLASNAAKVSLAVIAGFLAYTLVDRNIDLIGHEHKPTAEIGQTIQHPDSTKAVGPNTGAVTPTTRPDPEPPLADTTETATGSEPEDPQDNQEYSVRIVTSADNEILRCQIESLLENKKFKILESREIDEERNKLLYFSQNSLSKAEYVADILNRELNLAESNKFVPKMILSDQKQEKVLQIYFKNQ